MSPFRAPRENLGVLDAETAAALVGGMADIAVVVDAKGVVNDIAFGSEDLSADFDAELGGTALAFDRVHRDPRESRSPPGRGASASRDALASGESCFRARYRDPSSVPCAASRQKRRDRGGRAKSARNGRAPTAARRRATGAGAGLLALPAGRNPLPTPVSDGLGGHSHHRRADPARGRGEPRRRPTVGRDAHPRDRPTIPRGVRHREHTIHQRLAGWRSRRRTRRRCARPLARRYAGVPCLCLSATSGERLLPPRAPVARVDGDLGTEPSGRKGPLLCACWKTPRIASSSRMPTAGF